MIIRTEALEGECRDKAMAAFEYARPIVPIWVREVFIAGPHHRASDTGNASCQIDPDYARLCIYLAEPFFVLEEAEREETMAHEVAHSYTSPIRDAALDFIADENAQKAIRRWLEFCTSHLEITLSKMLRGEQ